MDAELSNEDLELVERAAGRVVSAGMAAPAVLFLEGMRPLNFVAGQFLRLAAPVAPAGSLDAIAALLEKRGAIEALCERIEEMDKNRRAER